MKDDCAFDVDVTIKPLWIRPASGMAQQLCRSQMEIRFAQLAHEVAHLIRRRLDEMPDEQGDDPNLWLLMPFSPPQEEP